MACLELNLTIYSNAVIDNICRLSLVSIKSQHDRTIVVKLFLSDIRHNVSVTHNFFCYAQLFSVTHNFFCYAQLFLLRTPLRTTFSVTHNFFLLRTTFSVTHTVTHNFFLLRTPLRTTFFLLRTPLRTTFSVTHTVTHNFFCYAHRYAQLFLLRTTFFLLRTPLRTTFFCYAHRYAQLFLLRTPLRTTFIDLVFGYACYACYACYSNYNWPEKSVYMHFAFIVCTVMSQQYLIILRLPPS